MAARLQVPVEAYILTLYPKDLDPPRRAPGAPAQSSELTAIALGLAVPSFWSSGQITQAFADANAIWTREADIEFRPVNITQRSEAVPANERDMWIHFINHLSPAGRAIGVGFVYDLPSDEGGWGGGRVAAISGKKASEGIAGFGGNLLAHELGHVLIDDPLHQMADGPSNLMYGSRNPRVANAGLLNPRQVELARTKATGGH